MPASHSLSLLSALVLLLVSFGSSSAFAQPGEKPEPGPSIGVSVGGAYGIERGGMEYLGFSFQVPERPLVIDTVGEGLGYSVGVVFDYPIGDRVRFSCRAAYVSGSASWYTALPGIALLTPVEGGINAFYQEAVAETRFTALESELAASVRVVDVGSVRLGIILGTAMGARLSLTESRRIRYHNDIPFTFSIPGFPDSLYSFPDTVYSVDRSVEGASSPRLSVRGGVTCRVPLGDRFALSADLLADYALTPLVNGSDWYRHNALARLSLLMRLGG